MLRSVPGGTVVGYASRRSRGTPRHAGRNAHTGSGGRGGAPNTNAARIRPASIGGGHRPVPPLFRTTHPASRSRDRDRLVVDTAASDVSASVRTIVGRRSA
jgi:hypothetical protein